MNERMMVVKLGEMIGYGNMMHLASKVWGEKMPGAEFAIGPCKTFVVPCECENPKDCDWCCGCGWLTEHVRETKREVEGI